jgi:quercetin dioxygenase-like cupin family protein
MSDVAKVAPRSVKILFENDKIRVMEIRFRKGQKLASHTHPANFTYAITAGKYKSVSPNGKSTTVKMKKGESGFSDGNTHTVENLSSFAFLQIELK